MTVPSHLQSLKNFFPGRHVCFFFVIYTNNLKLYMQAYIQNSIAYEVISNSHKDFTYDSNIYSLICTYRHITDIHFHFHVKEKHVGRHAWVCMHVLMYMCIHVHTYRYYRHTHACSIQKYKYNIHTSIYTHITQMCRYVYMHAFIHTFVCIFVCRQPCMSLLICVHVTQGWFMTVFL